MPIVQPPLNGVRPRSTSIIETINSKTKEDEELENYINSIEIDPKYVFGTQYFGTSEQYTEQLFKGIIDPRKAAQDTQAQINKHNKNVEKRARILSYYDHVLGKKLPPPIMAMGVGGGGKIPLKMPIVPSDYVFPEWFVPSLIPEGMNITPDIRDWSQEAKVQYVESGEFYENLNNGGVVIPELERLWKAKVNHQRQQNMLAGGGGSSAGGGGSSGSWDDTPLTDDSVDTPITNEPPFEMPNGSVRYNYFRNIMLGRGMSREVISEIWMKKGGKEWMESYLNRTKDTNLTNMKLEWDRIYQQQPYGTPPAEYPQVPITDTGVPFKEEPKQEPAPSTGVITADDYVRKPTPSTSSSSSSSSSSSDGSSSGGSASDKGSKFETGSEPLKSLQELLEEWRRMGLSKEQQALQTRIHRYPQLFPDYQYDPNTGQYIRKISDGNNSQPDASEPLPFTRTPIPSEPTKEEEEEEEDKKKRKYPPYPPNPPDPPNPKDPPNPEDPPKPKDPNDPTKKATSSNPGYLRPSFEQGGQDILAITEAEKLQEISDWNLFDLPIPENEDPDNPMYLKRIRDLNARFFGVHNEWHPKHLYQEPIRSQYTEPERLKYMYPMMIPQYMKSPMTDPYERRRFNQPTDAYRHDENTIMEYANRMELIYPDERNRLPLQPYQFPQKVNTTELMLSFK